MNYSDLNENITFTTRRLLNGIVIEHHYYNVITINENSLVRRYMIFPNAEHLKLEIQSNITSSQDKLSYINRLKLDFRLIFELDLMDVLREFKYDIINRQSGLKSIGSYLEWDEETNKYYIASHETGSFGANFEVWFISDMIEFLVEGYGYEHSFFDNPDRDNREFLLDRYMELSDNYETIILNIDKIFLIVEAIKYAIEPLVPKDPTLIHEKPDETKVSSTLEGIVKKKLNFNPIKGNKRALYFVLKQLYDKEMINNSYEEIADFLIRNVSGFEKSNINNLATEISRGTEPMNHRRIELPKDFI